MALLAKADAATDREPTNLGIYRQWFSALVEERDNIGTAAAMESNAKLRMKLRQAGKLLSDSRCFDAVGLVHKTYLFAAPWNFDDFMTAMEWNRQPQARFWLPRRKVLEGQHHIATRIQAFIDDPKARMLSLSTPPGAGKSTLIKFLLAYIAGREPKSANMYCSYGDGMVKMMFDSLTALLTDKEEYCFGQIFPTLGTPSISAEYSTLSYRRKGDFPTLGLVSIGGAVTGRTRANRFMVTDDLVKNDEMAQSPERLEKLWNDYNNTLTTRTIGDNVKQIMLGTIWSIYDPISRQKQRHEGKAGYTFIALPVCDEEGHSNFNYDHPDRYTDEKIADIRESLDPVAFSCLYMQKGIEKEGMAFAESKLKFYNGVLPDGEPDRIIFHADVAWGGGDSFAMPIGYVYGNAVYIDDVIFDKGDKTVTKPRVVGKIIRHKINMGNFEANNGGDEYCDDIGRMLKEEKYTAHLTSKKAPSRMSKLTRIEQYQDDIREFYYRSEKCQDEEYRRFMREFMTFSFTQKNLHDDAADSLAGLAAILNMGTGLCKIKSGRRVI